MTFVIEFHTEDDVFPDNDKDHFIATVNRARHWHHGTNNVTIHIHKRSATGWLEYSIDVKNEVGNRIIYIGAIQRAVGADSEFHS